MTGDARHTTTIHLVNKRAGEVPCWLEPWGDTCSLVAGGEGTLVTDGPGDVPVHLVVGEDAVTAWHGTGCTAAIQVDGRAVARGVTPVPPYPAHIGHYPQLSTARAAHFAWLFIENGAETGAALVLLPWGMPHALRPAGMYGLLVASSVPGAVTVEIDDGRIGVHGWPPSEVVLYTEIGEVWRGTLP